MLSAYICTVVFNTELSCSPYLGCLPATSCVELVYLLIWFPSNWLSGPLREAAPGEAARGGLFAHQHCGVLCGGLAPRSPTTASRPSAARATAGAPTPGAPAPVTDPHELHHLGW